MANTLSGTSSAIVAQVGLKQFASILAPMVGTFSLDVSPAGKGAIVNTRIIPVAGTAVDLSTVGGDRSHANVCADIATTEVSVSTANYAVGFTLSDDEIAQMENGVLSDMTKKLLETKATILAKKCQDLVFADITKANYGVAILANVSAMTYDNVVDLRTTANGLGMIDGSLVVNSTQAGGLRKDDSIALALNSGKDTVTSGTLGTIAGFRTIEAPTLPANSEGLCAFIAAPSAMALVARPTYCQHPEMMIAYEVQKDPQTGLVLTYCHAWDPIKRKAVHTYEINFGHKVGDDAALKRIITGAAESP